MKQCQSVIVQFFDATEIITNQFLNYTSTLTFMIEGYYFLKILATMYTKALMKAYFVYAFLL